MVRADSIFQSHRRRSGECTSPSGLHALDGGRNRQFFGCIPAQVHPLHCAEVGRTPAIVGHVAAIHQIPLIDGRKGGAGAKGIEVGQSEAVAELVDDGADAAEYVALQTLAV